MKGSYAMEGCFFCTPICCLAEAVLRHSCISQTYTFCNNRKSIHTYMHTQHAHVITTNNPAVSESHSPHKYKESLMLHIQRTQHTSHLPTHSTHSKCSTKSTHPSHLHTLHCSIPWLRTISGPQRRMMTFHHARCFLSFR